LSEGSATRSKPLGFTRVIDGLAIYQERLGLRGYVRLGLGLGFRVNLGLGVRVRVRVRVSL